MKIYLAGKVGKGDWRHTVVDGEPYTRGEVFMRQDLREYPGDAGDWVLNQQIVPPLRNAIFDSHDYVGPFFVGCDHGCGHRPNQHGAATACFGGDWEIDQSEQAWIHESCLRQIRDADVVFAWISSTDAFGTISEIGYAKAYNKQVWIAGPREFDDLWFVYCMADKLWISDEDTPREILSHLLKPDLGTMPYAQYLKTDHWQRVRKAALERAEHRCQTCNTDEHLHVHHRTYENRGAERDNDVTVLCKSCHERFHGVTNGRVTHTVR